MADIPFTQRFDPELNNQKPQDYTGFSKGAKSKETAAVLSPIVENTVFAGNLTKESPAPTQHATYTNPGQQNNSLGILLEGAGNVMKSGYEVANSYIKKNIRDDLTTSVDQVRDEFGVAAADKVLGDAGGPVPQELESQAQYLDNLTEAYRSGQLRDSHYWAKMDVVARQMRARYPSYRDYIDNQISSLTGNDPANALRTSLKKEALKPDTEQNKITKLETDLSKSGQLLRAMPDYFTRKNGSNPYTLTEMNQKLATDTKVQADLKWSQDRLSASVANGKATSDDAKKTASKDLWSKISQAQAAQNSVIATSYKDFQSKIVTLQKQAANRPFTEDEQNQVRAVFATYKQQVKQLATNTLFNNLPGQNFNYASVLGNDGVKDIMGTVDTYLGQQEDALINQQFGVLQHNSAMSETMQTTDKLNVLDQSPATRALAVAKDVYSPVMLDRMLGDGKFADAAQASINNLSQMAMGSGQSSFSKELGNAQDKGISDPGFYKEFFRRNQTQIEDQSYPVAVRANQAKAAFADNSDWFAKLRKQDQQQVYTNYTSPKFVQSMEKLKSEGQNDAYNSYQQWSLKTFASMWRTEASDAANIVTNRRHMQLTWDPKSYQFGLAQHGSVLSEYGSFPNPASSFEKFIEGAVLEPTARSSLTSFNKAVLGEANIIKAGGGDPNVELPKIFQAMGVDLNAKKTDSGINNFYDTIVNAVSGITATTSEEKGKKLSDYIGKNEAPGGYSQTYGNTATGLDKPLEESSLGDVFKAQTNMLTQGAPSTAVGKYQFTRPTLVRLMGKLGMNENTQFNSDTQDQMFMQLAKERGLDSYMNGNMSREDFANSLSKEWASLPSPSRGGKSYYEGVGNNHATDTLDHFLTFLDAVKKNGGQLAGE